MELHERLCECIDKKDWTDLAMIIKPSDFAKDKTGSLVDPRLLGKVAETLTTENANITNAIKILLLKCLVNSCVNGYLHKAYDTRNATENLYHEYSSCLNEILKKKEKSEYSHKTHFPYDGVAHWAINAITTNEITDEDSTEEQLNIARLSIQFICNLLTFSCKTKKTPERENLPKCIESTDFRKTLIELVGHQNSSINRATCALIHNVIVLGSKDFFEKEDEKKLFLQLILLTKSKGIQSALDTVMFLIKQPFNLRNLYEYLSVEEKLVLLDVIFEKIGENGFDERNCECLPCDAVQFLSERFKRTSDLILKTEDSYLKDMEPVEVTVLLDILGALTANNLENCKPLKDDASLLINCIFLLKSLQMAGKEKNNCFTPIQKLSELAPCEQDVIKDEEELQKHPAFGFKVALIRVIGNMVEKHKKNQDLVRETDGIPLLLDCSNIDARNPFIIQWVIFAMRNLTENNSENQKVIQNCTKIGVVDNAVLREMGMTLQKDNVQDIGIVPLDSIRKM